jgi:hypothetical protein
VRLPRSLLMTALASCSTTGSTLDMIMPDRWGVGAGSSSVTGKTYGSSDMISHGGGEGESERYEETYNGNETIAATWLEWDIPNVSSDKVSFTGMRDSFIRDYRGSTQPSPGLISLSKQVDETGAETWSIGASEALTTALLALLAALGYKIKKDHQNDTK